MSDPPNIQPMDGHNEALVANVHPQGWVNPVPAGRYNMVVIGAGTAGLVTAAGVAGLGGKVALVERHLLGGDCLNYGCVPSKCVLASARAARAVRDAGAFGVKVPGGAQVDFAAVMERMRRVRSRISAHDAAARFRQLGVDVFLGAGRFASPESVEVDGLTLRFSRACIATGARAVELPIDGLAEAGCLTNETVFSLTALPRRLAVLGGGPIGCELGQAFARLGSEVTLVEKGPRLLPREDEEVSALLAGAMKRDGVRLCFDTEVARVDSSGAGKVLKLAGEEKGELEVDEVLLAVGRAPNVEALNLEAAGVEYDPHRGVAVDDRLRTANRRIYAAGDVCMRYKFTHAADAAARIVIQNALFWGRRKLSALTIPWCTYTDPEIAHVGLSEADARREGIACDVFTRDLHEVDRALVDGQEDGLVKVLVRKGSGRILGATIVASHAGEMIGEITLAMTAGVGLGALGGVIHPYPTQAEAVKQLGDAFNRKRLTPRVARWFKKLLAWKR